MRYLIMAVGCAWVLWGGDGVYWLALGGQESKAGCEHDLLMKRVALGQLTIRPLDDVLSGKPEPPQPAKGPDNRLLVCLPDTIDPRGPKR